MSDRVTGADAQITVQWSEDVGRLAQALVRSALDERPGRATHEAELAGTILSLLDLSLPDPSGLRPAPSPAEMLRGRVKNYVRLHLRDPDLTIDRIAAALSCSKRYLHMCFADQGLSITEFIWTERLDQCRRELEQEAPSGRTITEVAFSWGFNSSSHFSRLFKKRFGAPPSRTRHCS
jgi:AraC-like DNA-binding protein